MILKHTGNKVHDSHINLADELFGT